MNCTLSAHRKTVIVTPGKTWIYYPARKPFAPRIAPGKPRTTPDYKDVGPATPEDIGKAYSALTDIKCGFGLPPFGADLPSLAGILRAEPGWRDCDFILMSPEGDATLVTMEEVREAMAGKLRREDAPKRS